MVNAIMKLIHLFRKLIEWMGVDYRQFEVILQAKLTMDNRKMTLNNNQRKTMKNSLSMQTIFYVMMGGFLSMMLIGTDTLFFFSTMLFSFIMIMVIMGLVSEFHTILFDTRDNAILLPRPVSARTLLFVRVIHIMIYLMLISLSLSVIPLITFVIKYGVASMLLLLADVVLITLFAVFLTNLLYLLLMRFTSGERLKDFVVYAQIVMAVLFMGGYQLMPRLAENRELMSHFNQLHGWMFLVPPFWMSGSLTAIVNGGFNIQSAILLILSVAMPLIGLWLVTSVLAQNFNQNLSTLDQGDTTNEKMKGKPESSSLVDLFSRLCSYSNSERISFRMIWKIANRDRKFKQSVYPALGYVFIMILMTFLNGKTPFAELGSTKKFLALIYIPSFIMYILAFSLKFSDNFKASWIYQTIPVSHPGQLISGAFKAMMVQLYVPVFIVVNIFTLYIWGASVVKDILFGLCATLLMGYLMIMSQPYAFPFSEERSAQQSGQNTLRAFLMFFAIAILAGIHYLLINLNVNVHYGIPVILAVLILVSRKYRMVLWHKMSIGN